MITAKDLRDALNDASSHNGRFLISFLLFQAYLLITVGAVTDYTLLMPESTVKLPLLDVEMPLFGFFIVAPLILLIIHFNLLLHLLQHARILHAYKPLLDRNADEQLKLPTFLLNFGILFQPATVNYALVRMLFFMIFYLMPLSLLLFVQVRFADYHDLGMTAWHFLLVILDVSALVIYWTRIRYPDQLLTEEYDSGKKLLLWLLRANVNAFRTFFKSVVAAIRHWISGSIPKRILHLFLLPLLLLRKTPRGLRALGIPFFSLSNAFIILLSVLYLVIVILIKSDWFERKQVRDFGEFIPHLSVTERTLVKAGPSDVIIATYLQKGWSLDSAWLQHTQGLNLRGRDLRLANFSKSRLLKADLREVNLNGAMLAGMNLNEADLFDAQLNGANLSGAQLNGVVLPEARLNGAVLGHAQLNGADLRGAQMNGAYLLNAQLNGADLSGAQLNGTDLSGRI